MYVSFVRVMATMARITTRSRAAAMMTAAVGLRPKMVVRSVVVVLERGNAEALSSLFVVLSFMTPPPTLPLPLMEPLAAGASAGFEGAGVGSDGAVGVAGLASVAGLAPLCAIAAE